MPIDIQAQEIRAQILSDLPQLRGFLAYVKDLYGDNFVAAIATGSRTTNEHTPESDLDLDILVKDGVEHDSTKVKDLEFKLQEFPKIATWVKSAKEYEDPAQFFAAQTPSDKFALDGYSGLAKHVLWADVKNNGVVIAGHSEILERMPPCESIPKYEGFELFLVATKEFAKGNVGKALLRAAAGAYVAVEGKPPPSYNDLQYVEIFPEKLRELLRVANDARHTKIEIDQDEVWSALHGIKYTVQPIAKQEILKLAPEERKKLHQKIRFYQLRTIPRFAQSLVSGNYDAKILDMFAQEFLAAYSGEEVRLFVDQKYELDDDTKQKIKPLFEKIIKYYNEITKKIVDDPREIMRLIGEAQHYDANPTNRAFFSKGREIGRGARTGQIKLKDAKGQIEEMLESGLNISKQITSGFQRDITEAQFKYFGEWFERMQSGDMSEATRYDFYTKFSHVFVINMAAFKIPLLAFVGKKDRALELTDLLIEDARKEGLKRLESYALREKARIVYDLKRYEEAVNCFDETLLQDPEDTLARIQKGRCLAQLCKYDEALKEYVEVKRQLDESQSEAVWSASIRNDIGNTLSSLKRDDEALAEFNEAIKLNPRHPGYRMNLGDLLLKFGDKEGALREYDTALELGRRNYGTLMRVVRHVYPKIEGEDRIIDEKLFNKTISYLIEVVQQNPTEEVYSDLLTLTGRARTQQAFDAVWSQAEKLFPDRSAVLLSRAFGLGYMHEHEQAVNMINRAYALLEDQAKKDHLTQFMPGFTSGLVKFDPSQDRFYFDIDAAKIAYGMHFEDWKNRHKKQNAESSSSTSQKHG